MHDIFRFALAIIFFMFIVSFTNNYCTAGSLLSNDNGQIDNTNLKNITKKLRCLVCENQSIYDSNSDFALLIKDLVKDKLDNNISEMKIIIELQEEYGNSILLDTPFNKKNLIIWLIPPIIIIIGIYIIYASYFRHNIT